MSLLGGSGIAVTGKSNGAPDSSSPLDITTTGSMSDASNTSKNSFTPAIDPHRDARAIVRLIQCQQCSLPLRNPLTLPCGNSLCKDCVPQPRLRSDTMLTIGTPKLETFDCPFEQCGKSHTFGFCQDVTLAKVMDRVNMDISRCRPLTAETPTLLETQSQKSDVSEASEAKPTGSRILNGGRLVATYTLAELGELDYDSEVSYQSMSPTGDNYEHLDVAMLSHLKEVTKSELDCHVCFGLMLDPITTNCGHTFCRQCVARVLDHSTQCPICRRALPIPPSLREVRSNHRLNKLLDTLCPELVASRAETAKEEEKILLGEKNVPLFVCSLAYPSMPCFLHIFEPRYRLMIRRAIESGDRKFGMIMYNRRSEPQGDLGSVHFMLYGTLLHITSMQMLPDGRSLIETRGLTRFRVKDHGQLDGYMVGNIEPIDDIPWADEVRAEAVERARSDPDSSSPYGHLDKMSSLDILKIPTAWIPRMQMASAPWLHSSVFESYGEPPNDPALFPYWFASILPIADDEKYKLLPTTSVRERLKICASWVERIEAQQR